MAIERAEVQKYLLERMSYNIAEATRIARRREDTITKFATDVMRCIVRDEDITVTVGYAETDNNPWREGDFEVKFESKSGFERGSCEVTRRELKALVNGFGGAFEGNLITFVNDLSESGE